MQNKTKSKLVGVFDVIEHIPNGKSSYGDFMIGMECDAENEEVMDELKTILIDQIFESTKHVDIDFSTVRFKKTFHPEYEVIGPFGLERIPVFSYSWIGIGSPRHGMPDIETIINHLNLNDVVKKHLKF